MYFDFANILVFSLFAVGFVVINLFVGRILRPKSTGGGGKLAIYECAEPTVGQAWIRFDIRFYTVALMFVVFDVEVALLFPWGVVFRELVERGPEWGMLGLIEAGTFILILMVGLAYVWARGDIDWTRTAVVKRTSFAASDERTAVSFDDPRSAPAGDDAAPDAEDAGGRDA